MVVEIDDKSGFCFGVVNAISKAEESLADGGHVKSLGDIVHNRVEVQRLEDMGLGTIDREKFEKMCGGTVLIRAHGEPPATFSGAQERGIRIIDATCPVVSRLQQQVKEAYERMKTEGGTLVILGKKGHAEVVGLTGQVGGDVVVVEDIGDLDAIDFTRPVFLLSQTTQSLSLFEKVADEVRRRAADPGKVVVSDTICRQVANREPHLREFAARFDTVVFVSGLKSSNGKLLYDVCKSVNPRTYMVEDETEIDPAWLVNSESVGICGATSTPKWLMRRVAEKIEKIGKTL